MDVADGDSYIHEHKNYDQEHLTMILDNNGVADGPVHVYLDRNDIDLGTGRCQTISYQVMKLRF